MRVDNPGNDVWICDSMPALMPDVRFGRHEDPQTPLSSCFLFASWSHVGACRGPIVDGMGGGPPTPGIFKNG